VAVFSELSSRSGLARSGFAAIMKVTHMKDMREPEKSIAVLDGSEVRTLTKSEQRKKNRLENRGQKKDSRPQAEREGNIFVRAYNFFVEAKEELGRVIWPTRKETIDSTWRLLILVIISGIFLGLVDGILTRLLSLIV